ncbi:MAG TPA: hypothetical protein VMR99_01760 [Candidatus Paceibacterota bacterium]|nr:hypothetical protein [Candidatus Paceibacterota bacterium]
MPDYNPNSIWGSKEKKYVYGSQQPEATKPNQPAGTPLGGGAGGESKPPSFFRRHGLLFFTIGIFLAIGLAAFIYYLLLPPPAPDVVISFSNPGSIVVGEPFPLIVTVSNESKVVLENADLNIMLPGGISFASSTAPTQSVGTLSSGTINPPQTLWLVATGDEGTTQTVNTTLTYQTAATASSTLTATANASLSVGTQSALTLSYSAPSSIFSGQNFDIAVNYQNDTPGVLQGVQLEMQYPPAYHFVSSSTTAPTGPGNNAWNLGTIPANATGTLVITGNIVGPSQAQYQLTGMIGASFSGQYYQAFSAPVSFAVTPSPLSLAIALNNSSTYIAKLGDNLNYALTYTNNSNVTFESVNISAALVGQMYDFSSLKTNGSFNSQSNTITWYAANTPALASLAPGQSGTVNFTINTQQAFPIKLSSDKNYALSVTATAQSPTVPPNTAGTNTTSISTLTSKVGGVIALTANAYAKETAPGITNTGPYPPKVDQPTEYSIHWDIVNYSTDATSVTVSAYLQSGSTFTGVATSTGILSTSTPTYDAGTGLVTWTIPFIPATTGVISPPAQAIFQITNTPAINQIGQAVTLLGPTTLTATDEYTGSPVIFTAPAVTTHLTSDPSVSADETGDVTQ